MLYAIPRGGCFCPIQPLICYGVDLIEEGETVPILELVSKEKDGFGDTFYFIRHSNGVTSKVYEGDLDAFMKKNGVTELQKGKAYMYPKKKRMAR
ncbi:hypothetical protein M6D81_22660 [Paenibacillus sp. J5C_2022]|uniref:hypothetical protein n=1 Tax=Paenibacillus sp. J5C2022 TaxID=2977129 RepID=UPI0021D116BB|nr:hypothetical protein [Paenibacillus sp. J5C2022]MCU6711503.1 hypothetical protein [Paenibacillus sp. J5C2022]